MGNIVTAREKTIHPQRNEVDGQLIRFPHEDNSIESICVNRKDLLLPINGTDSGLYRYCYDDQNQCWFQKECLFETKSDEIIINVKSLGNTFGRGLNRNFKFDYVEDEGLIDRIIPKSAV